jgi:hypothetical protein
MAKLSERELWACASTLIEMHGAEVGNYVAGRIRALRAEDDHAGVLTWVNIANRIEQLYGPNGPSDIQ